METFGSRVPNPLWPLYTTMYLPWPGCMHIRIHTYRQVHECVCTIHGHVSVSLPLALHRSLQLAIANPTPKL